MYEEGLFVKVGIKLQNKDMCVLTYKSSYAASERLDILWPFKASKS
jgi:hypothetical protein